MRRKHLTFGILFLVLLCSFIALVGVSQQKSIRQLENEMKQKEDALYLEPHGAWPRYKAKFDFYEGKIQKFITEHNKLIGIRLHTNFDWTSTLVAGIDKNITAYYLNDTLRTLLGQIDTAGNEASFFYIDQVLKAWYAYYDAVAAYNSHPQLSPEEQISIQQPSEYAATPIFLCQGSCDARFETASLAQVSHQVYCTEKHGSSGTTGVRFYLCSGSCSRSAEHWLVCGGTCGNRYAPKRINRGQGNYEYVANSPHYVKCEKNIYDFWNPNATCDEEYYTCQYSKCPKSNTHWSGSTPPQTTDNTPNCQDCTSDCSSPCVCSNSGTCGGTASSPPPSNNPTPKPKLVDCGRTACKVKVSHSDKHRVKLCASGCGNGYWSCNPSAVSWHETPHPCLRSNCGASYTNCSKGNGTCTGGKYKWHKS